MNPKKSAWCALIIIFLVGTGSVAAAPTFETRAPIEDMLPTDDATIAALRAIDAMYAANPDANPDAVATAAWTAAITTSLQTEASLLTMGVPGRGLGAEIGYRMPYATCDVDHDGVEDLVVDRLIPQSRINPTPAPARIEMRSGATGDVLWEIDDLDHEYFGLGPFGVDKRAEAGYRIGDPLPSIDDIDGDGVCEIFAWNVATESFVNVPNPLGSPRIYITNVTFTIRALSGATGADVWTRSFEGSFTAYDDFLFAPRQAIMVEDLPTGSYLDHDADGARAIVKTTDIKRTYLAEPYAGAVLGISDASMDYMDHETNETLHLVDAHDGTIIWQRELPSAQSQGFVPSRQLGSPVDITGDHRLDIVLEERWIPNPTADEVYAPITGEEMARPNTGLAVSTVDGARDGTGATLWTEVVVDEPPAQANAQTEENQQNIVWTHTQALPDIDGDGTSEIGLRYLVIESGVPTTTVGARQTHVVPLSGSDGDTLWDVTVQGWAVFGSSNRNATTDALTLVAADVVASGRQTGSASSGFDAGVRIMRIKAATGESEWTEEYPYSLGGGLPYMMAIASALDDPAPFDLDADGYLDLVTPAQAATGFSSAQRLAAAQRVRFDVRSGDDGDVLTSATLNGATGRLMPCAGADGSSAFLTFSGRRVDLTMVDFAGSAIPWTEALFADISPRSSHFNAIITSVYANCGLLDDGRHMLYGLALGRDSPERGAELLSLFGVIDMETGEHVWRYPHGTVSSADAVTIPPRLQAVEVSLQERMTPFLLVGVIGIALGALPVPLVQRIRRGQEGLAGIAVIGIVLLLAASPVASAIGGLDAGPTALDVPRRLPAALPETTDVRGEPPASMIGNLRTTGPAHPMPDRADIRDDQDIPELNRFFRQDLAASYSYPIGDVDEDGIEDVAVLYTCLYYLHFECLVGPSGDLLQPEFWAAYVTEYSGQVYQQIVGISTATGEIMWNTPLQAPGAPPPAISHSVNEYVIGTIGLESGETGVLVYRWDKFYPLVFGTAVVLTHTFRLYGGEDGRLLWQTDIEGLATCHVPLCWSAEESAIAESAIPMIREAVDGGQEAIFVGLIGYERIVDDPFYHQAESIAGMRQTTIHDSYVPRGELVRLDPETGAITYRVPTLDSAAPGRSMLVVWDDYPVDPRWDDFNDVTAPFQDHYYWRENVCCGDLNGDGEPDLAFESYEWSATPLMAADGPYPINAYLNVVDGATGSLLYQVPVALDADVGVQRPLAITQRHGLDFDIYAIGDLDGDQRDDLLVRKTYQNADYVEELEVRSGSDGHLVWQRSLDRDGALRVLGDVDGDGAPDLEEIRWFAYDDMQELLPREHELLIRSGATGDLITTHPTTTAPFDVAFRLNEPTANGRVDLDHDGLDEVLLDEPVQWPDGTMVHRLRFVQAATGESVWEAPAVGAVGEPHQVPDLDGDGRDDIVILSGDVIDLWVTAYGSRDSTAMWSRPLTGLPNIEYYSAFPRLAFHGVARNDTAGHDLVVTFHLALQYRYTSPIIYVCCDTETMGEQVRYYVTDDHVSVVRALDGQTGAIKWSVPDPSPLEPLQPVAGDTPATTVYKTFQAEQQKSLATQGADIAVRSAPLTGTFIAGVVLGAIASLGVVVLRRRDAGVPELDM